MTENEVTVMMAEAIDKDRQYAPLTCSTKHLMIFAEMVAEKEREACAKIIENILLSERANEYDVILRGAEEIRARGQA